jgi:alginate O-acetyltransferase complex protein AlgI
LPESGESTIRFDMVFTSPVFLFLFLPLALMLVWAAPCRFRNGVLLLLGLFFYAWGEKGYVLLMALSIGMNYLFGKLLGRWNECSFGKLVLSVAVLSNLTILIFFKYTNFLLENLHTAFDSFDWSTSIPRTNIHLPIGISFFTFEAISYLVDIRRGTIPATRDPIKLGVFLTLFPHLIAGPIVRYGDMTHSLDHPRLNVAQAARGVRRLLVGLAKKLLLANSAGRTADVIFAHQPDWLAPSAIGLGVLCYTLQIYFDFSGYSDMAIGLGRLVGFELAENFRYPYAADSITDFWRRWHISLSSWFRDYVYIPLGGNRQGLIRTAANLMTVFTLCGLWHGASWSFLLWGWWHGLFLIFERVLSHLRIPSKWAIVLAVPRHLYVVVVVMLGWIFFRADNLNHAAALFRALFHWDEVAGHPAADFLHRELLLTLIVGGVAALPLPPHLKKWRDHWGFWGRILQTIGLIALAVLCWIVVVSETYDPFIYFRF